MPYCTDCNQYCKSSGGLKLHMNSCPSVKRRQRNYWQARGAAMQKQQPSLQPTPQINYNISYVYHDNSVQNIVMIQATEKGLAELTGAFQNFYDRGMPLIRQLASQGHSAEQIKRKLCIAAAEDETATPSDKCIAKALVFDEADFDAPADADPEVLEKHFEELLDKLDADIETAEKEAADQIPVA